MIDTITGGGGNENDGTNGGTNGGYASTKGDYGMNNSNGSGNSSATRVSALEKQKVTALMGAVAMAALGTAMFAVFVGQKKGAAKSHKLRGCVERRVKLFSAFADRHVPSGAVERPTRTVELSETEYKGGQMA